MAMQARQQQQEVEVEDETFGPMPLNRLEVFIAVEFPIVTFELLLLLLIFAFITYYDVFFLWNWKVTLNSYYELYRI